MMPNESLLHKQLSDREFEVFSLLVAGKSITEIANNLHLSVKTVSTHKTRIMQKMGMSSLSEWCSMPWHTACYPPSRPEPPALAARRNNPTSPAIAPTAIFSHC